MELNPAFFLALQKVSVWSLPRQSRSSVRWSKFLLNVLYGMWGTWVAKKVKMLWKNDEKMLCFGENRDGIIYLCKEKMQLLASFTLLWLILFYMFWSKFIAMDIFLGYFDRVPFSNVKKNPINFIRSAINSWENFIFFLQSGDFIMCFTAI